LSNKPKKPEQEPIDVSHEELEELKREMRSAQLTAWAIANQQKIIAGVVVLLMVIVGVSLWKEHRASQRASAATLYQQALNVQQVDDKRSLLQAIIKDYDDTVYGDLARLLLVNVDEEHAAEYLQALMDRPDVDDSIKMQARLDLAQLRLDAGDKAAARELLATGGLADYEQLRHYLLAQAASDDAQRVEHLKKARDAISHDAELSQRIERQLSTLDAAAAGQG
jgi:predicted negative regulator of RcsB-dependent stress response